jgi:hypothetical protein
MTLLAWLLTLFTGGRVRQRENTEKHQLIVLIPAEKKENKKKKSQ